MVSRARVLTDAEIILERAKNIRMPDKGKAGTSSSVLKSVHSAAERLAKSPGRPKGSTGASKYFPGDAEETYRLCLLGLSNNAIARYLNIHIQTFDKWQNTIPEFASALKRGRETADAVVAEALFNRAKGFTNPEEKVFQYKGEEVRVPVTEYYPPDVSAAIYWLNNRRGSNWKTRASNEQLDAEGNVINNSRPPNIVINAVQVVRAAGPEAPVEQDAEPMTIEMQADEDEELIG